MEVVEAALPYVDARRRGLLDELKRPDQEHIELMRAANEQVGRWMDERY